MANGIDDIMAPLIQAMNALDYIETFSCCEGHPEESAIKQYGYAVANVVFEILDEPQNLFAWLLLARHILLSRKQLKTDFAYIIEKKFGLNENDRLCWNWEIKIQATGKTPESCRLSLNNGIEFLRNIFVKETKLKEA